MATDLVNFNIVPLHPTVNPPYTVGVNDSQVHSFEPSFGCLSGYQVANLQDGLGRLPLIIKGHIKSS